MMTMQQLARLGVARRVHAAAVAATRRAMASSPSSSPSSPPPAFVADEFRPFVLADKRELSHNVAVYRFEFDSPETPSGLFVASALKARAPVGEGGGFMHKSYTPLTSADQPGHVELLVKAYPDGNVSKYFAGLAPGDVVELRGPIAKRTYEPNEFEHVVMLAGGSGITPMTQMVDAVCRDPEDRTRVTLVFANQGVRDVVLRDWLTTLADESDGQVSVHFTVDAVGEDEDSAGLRTGFIDQTMLADLGVSPATADMVYVCGPPPMYESLCGSKVFFDDERPPAQGELAGVLRDMGFDPAAVYKF